MGVSEAQAMVWENDSNEPAFRELHQQLLHARTLDWKTRLVEYYRWLDQRSLDQLRCVRDDFSCSAYPQVCEDDPLLLRDFKAWRRRETMASHRAKRIGTEFHGFMHLPAEIRTLVYEQALIKGKLAIPHIRSCINTGDRFFTLTKGDVYTSPFSRRVRPRYEGTSTELEKYLDEWPPQLGIIAGVSRLVHTEAIRVFLRENQFVFPRGVYDPLIWFGDTYERAAVQSQWLRDVSFAFSHDDGLFQPCIHAEYVTPSHRRLGLELQLPKYGEPPLTRLGYLEKIWALRIAEIKKFRLNRLQLSFDECFCPDTRHRRVAWVLGELMRDWHDYQPKIIEISGWDDDEEKEFIGQMLGTKGNASTMVVRFEGQSNKDCSGNNSNLIWDPTTDANSPTSDNVLAEFDFDAFLFGGSYYDFGFGSSFALGDVPTP
ncbi:hypothetical protein SUNI508_02109 [Seiridium unicorne]|uniref:Uncharacterized protein n=1 Tax=Seiridium unicorne TaxID=138068 RepID=A0ABR2UL35_9PEZI